MKGCGGVSGELELIPQHFSRWQIDGERQTTATTEGIFFHSLWQRRSRSWLRGLNQPLTMSLCETSFSHMVLFSAPHLSVFPAHKSKWLHLTADSGCLDTKEGGKKVVNSTSCSLDRLILEQPWGGRRGLSSYELPLHIASQIAVQNATAQVIRNTQRHGGEGWNLQLAGRWEDRFASQWQRLSLQSRQLVIKKKSHYTFFTQPKVEIILRLCAAEATMHNLNHSSCMIVLSSMFCWFRLWTCNKFTISWPMLFWERCSISFAQLRQRQ